jgi:hypothetical protein
MPEVAEGFNSGWTPTILVKGAEGCELRRCQGYLGPERFVGEMSLARLMDTLDRRDLENASDRLGEALELISDDPAHEPEALYWSVVIAFRLNSDREDLAKGWSRLLDVFPQSE